MEKFVFEKNRPPGDWINWRIGSGWFEVAGVEHRIQVVLRFLRAVAAANDSKRDFGIELETEPDNKNHGNAIKVCGRSTGRDGLSTREHLGYVPREIADEVARKYRDTPIAAELKQVKVGDTRIFISIAGLIPRGTPKE